MNRKQLEKLANKLGVTLYKERVMELGGEAYNWYLAKDYIQYDGGNNTPKRFETLQRVQDYLEFKMLDQ